MSSPTSVAGVAAAALERAAEIVAPWAQSTARPEPERLDVAVEAADLVAATAALAAARWGRLSAITGLDLKAPATGGPRPAGRAPQAAAPTTDDLEVLYHFCAGAAVLTLRVRVCRADPRVPSLHAVLVYVDFFERELHELFGVEIDGAPSRDRLLLSDDWPADVYPLRKDAVMPAAPESGS